ncbi:MAG TPA: Dam family site-specific DNA-(adenine-N6)-methyltransferase [Candidatus Coproplasma stercoravium]|nr:Dam family site-specific DNA-(adenine-N6)-methyltransferase [Candidatus Coproplasma stercoravium]
MLYSPLNYQGNKSRIVDYLLALLPDDTTSIREIFCGSAILSFASQVNQIHLNDINPYILDLIRYFHNNEAEAIITQADEVIERYGLTNTFYQGRAIYPEFQHEGLSRYNKDAYNLLRADYNADKDIVKLFVLLIYGFNHYLRFNNKDEFNVPVGKVDFVKTLRDKTKAYCNAIRNKQLHITNLDFRCEQLYIGAEQTTLFYFDPPYLITQAPYNISWTEQDERDLLNLIDGLNGNGYRFMLSNVSQSNGKRNNLLCDWMQKYNVCHIHRQYLNSSYQKKNLSAADEVVISNF